MPQTTESSLRAMGAVGLWTRRPLTHWVIWPVPEERMTLLSPWGIHLTSIVMRVAHVPLKLHPPSKSPAAGASPPPASVETAAIASSSPPNTLASGASGAVSSPGVSCPLPSGASRKVTAGKVQPAASAASATPAHGATR